MPYQRLNQVLVQNIDFKVKKDAFMSWINSMDEVVDCNLLTSGKAFISFRTRAGQEAALRYDRHLAFGREIRVSIPTEPEEYYSRLNEYRNRWRKRFRQSNIPPSSLYIGNLPFDATEDDVRKFFKSAAEVVRIVMIDKGKAYCKSRKAK